MDSFYSSNNGNMKFVVIFALKILPMCLLCCALAIMQYIIFHEQITLCKDWHSLNVVG